MHKAVFLCGSLCEMVSRQHIVFYGDKQHIPDTLGLNSNQTLVLRQMFAGLYRVVNGVAENGADLLCNFCIPEMCPISGSRDSGTKCRLPSYNSSLLTINHLIIAVPSTCVIISP